MNKQKTVVHLRVYRSQNGKVSYNKDGSIQSENQSLKIRYGGLAWRNFLKNLKLHDYVKVEVEKVLALSNRKEVEGKVSEDVKAEVEKAFNPEGVKQLSPAERISELEAKLENMIKAKEAVDGHGDELKNERDALKAEREELAWQKEELARQKAELSKGIGIEDDALKAAKKEYKSVFDKKPHHSWSVEDIMAKIEEEKAKN